MIPSTTWVELAATLLCVFAMRWTGRLGMAIFAAVAAGACLLAAGSLSAAVFVVRRAVDLPWSARAGSEPSASERLRRVTEAVERLPARASLSLELALFWAGAALALAAFASHAAAAGWAGATVGLLAGALRPGGRTPGGPSRAELALFALASAPAVALSLLWVGPDPGLGLARTAPAVLTMSAGAAATGVSVLAMRWRVSERLSLPAAMALAVWSLTWFFARGEALGHEPMIVAWGVVAGGVLAAAGSLTRSLDGAASGVTLFLVSRVYSFLDWPAALAFQAASVLGWRPGARQRAAYELAPGALPLALAAGYFTFGRAEFMAAYLAACCAMTGESLSALLSARPRTKVSAVAAAAVVLACFPVLWGRYPDCGAKTALSALAAALFAWSAGEFLFSGLSDWSALAEPVRRTAMGAVAAAVALAISAASVAARGHPEEPARSARNPEISRAPSGRPAVSVTRPARLPSGPPACAAGDVSRASGGFAGGASSRPRARDAEGAGDFPAFFRFVSVAPMAPPSRGSSYRSAQAATACSAVS